MAGEKPTREELEQRVAVLEAVVAEHEKSDRLLTFLAHCGMAPTCDFLQALVRYLVENTGMDYACISRLAEDNQTVHIMACYRDGRFGENLSYPLVGTPEAHLLDKDAYFIPRSVCQMFPRNAVLQDIAAEAYAGTALVNQTGQPIGFMTLAGRHPQENSHLLESSLKLAAIRAASELERTGHEAKLRESAVFLETVLNSLTDSLYVVKTDDFTVLAANRAFAELVGIDRESIIGRRCYELTHHGTDPCDHPYNPCPLRETLRTGVPSTMEHIHFDSSGGERFITVSAFPIRNEQGRIERIVHLDRDVTERRKIAEALKKSEERLRLIYENTPLALGFMDQNGVLIDCNEAHVKIMGASKEKHIGLNLIKDIRNPALKAAIMAAYSGSMGTFEGEYTTITTGKAFHLRIFFVPMLDETRTLQGVQFLAEDITERKKLEDDSKRHAELLKQIVGEQTVELELGNKNLAEMNTTLHVLLQKRQNDKREMEERIVSNIRTLVFPFVEKMQNISLDAPQHHSLAIIQARLNEILSPLLRNLRQFNLTPREVQVAAMVKDGMTTKEIASTLGVETSSIDDHRNGIRKKLGLNRSENLQGKLQSLTY